MEANDHASDEEDEQKDKGKGLVGFMFGNVDNNLELEKEEAYLDDDARTHINNLESEPQIEIGLNETLKPSGGAEGGAVGDGLPLKRDDDEAVDYEDIQEMAEDLEDMQQAKSKATLISAALAPTGGSALLTAADDDYDDEDEDEDGSVPVQKTAAVPALPSATVPLPSTGVLHLTTVPQAGAPAPAPAPLVPAPPLPSEHTTQLELEAAKNVPAKFPILCIGENGEEIVRFSELFAPPRKHAPLALRKKSSRERDYEEERDSLGGGAYFTCSASQRDPAPIEIEDSLSADVEWSEEKDCEAADANTGELNGVGPDVNQTLDDQETIEGKKPPPRDSTPKTTSQTRRRDFDDWNPEQRFRAGMPLLSPSAAKRQEDQPGLVAGFLPWDELEPCLLPVEQLPWEEVEEQERCEVKVSRWFV